MNRRLTLAAAALLAAGLTGIPAHAAPKPKPFSGSYDLKLNPDPTGEATGAVDSASKGTGCTNLIEASTNRRAITVPGKGKLKVTLLAADPTNGATSAAIGVDWDLYILQPTGAKAPNTNFNADEELDSSHGATGSEQTNTTFTKATKVIIEVCNLIGTQDAKVTFSYKP